MNIERVKANVLEAVSPITGFETLSYPPPGGYRTKAGSRLPEYYLVYFLLVDLLDFVHIGPHEKVSFVIPLTFHDQRWAIEYRKMGFGLFAYERESYAGQIEESGAEIVRRIKRGVREARPYFDWRAEQALLGSKLNVKNRTGELYRRFEFFANLYKEKREQLSGQRAKAAQIRQEFGSGVRIDFGEAARNEVEWIALSAIESFFSWTEHVFVHLAIISGTCTTGQDVSELATSEWQDKFKAALDIEDREVKRHYDALAKIRTSTRNFVTHGAFGKNREAFRFHSGAGAVPMLLPHRGGKAAYSEYGGGLVPGQSHEQEMECVRKFVDYLRLGSLSPLWVYLDRDFDTDLNLALQGKYKEAMTSHEEMQRFAEEIEWLWDRAANMDW